MPTDELKPSPAYVRTLLRAVKVLIKQHPDEVPPGFREAFDAGDFFKASARAGRATEQLRVLDRLLFSRRPTEDDPVRRPQFHTVGWDPDCEMMDALHQLAAVASGLIARWNFPSFDGEILVEYSPGVDPRIAAEVVPGAIPRPAVPPLITDEERETLAWVRDRLIAALAWAADRTDEGGNEPTAYVQLVTLEDAAAIVRRATSTLERMKKNEDFPAPAVKKGHGSPYLYKWTEMRVFLGKNFAMVIPEKFPGCP